ncbi:MULTISPECIES: hypothetical protein [Bacillaceae]|uniref:Uncharacterized protein n=1 Tax=Evansella alkalicola TaxID=745819 RepID=A0ABS6JPP7_9BACI|nr:MULTISPECIES: hypothetical protein [Bacillaceae]MBU9720538.1 hypothetical protein [Bacillus alkalicola]
MNKFRPSIIHYASYVDITKILDEMIQDTDNEQFITILTEKKEEVSERYNKNFK